MVLVVVGIAVIVAGIVILITRPGLPGGEAKIPVFGEFKATSAGLVLVFLGLATTAGGAAQSATGGVRLDSGSVGGSPTPAVSFSESPTEQPPTEPPTARPTPTAQHPTVLTTGAVSARSGPLTLTIDEIDSFGSDVTVKLHADNSGSDTITLPLQEFFLIDQNGKSYVFNEFGGDWHDDVPARSSLSGSIELKEPIAGGVHQLRAGFTHVFGSFSVESITVTGISLR
jgi:hypothetical protein